jgi:hypothetical protein
MNAPIDPELERAVLAAIRDPLTEAIDRSNARSNHSARSRRLVAAVCASALIAGAGVAAWRVGRSDDAPGSVRGGTSTTSPPPPFVSPPVSPTIGTRPNVVNVRQLGCADPQPVQVTLDLPNIPSGDLEIEVFNRANGNAATLLWERHAIEQPDREGLALMFDVPGKECPGSTQTMTIWVDTPADTDLHGTIPLVFPPTGNGGISAIFVTPALT